LKWPVRMVAAQTSPDARPMTMEPAKIPMNMPMAAKH